MKGGEFVLFGRGGNKQRFWRMSSKVAPLLCEGGGNSPEKGPLTDNLGSPSPNSKASGEGVEVLTTEEKLPGGWERGKRELPSPA